MAKFVAIDAGGTKTQCWVADETRVLASATGGTVKLMSVGEEVATRRLQELVRGAAIEAHVGPDEITRTCMGLAGIGADNVRQWGEKTLRGMVSGKVAVLGDEAIALEAAFQGGPGVFVIAGTGSNVIGRCSDGTRLTAGGWGPVIGDEGSGGWIGLEAVKAALRARDRGQPTDLLEEIQGFWELKSLGELVAKANHSKRTNFAELTTVVASGAEHGDPVALRVLERAGEDLAEQVSLVVRKMRIVRCEPADVTRLCFTGSVLGRISLVREAMTERLKELVPEMTVSQSEVNALEGALWIARRG
jgi:glucosamine kinase